MSLSAVSQTQTNTRGEDNVAGTVPDGVSNSPTVDTVNFGNFHDEIQDQIQTLQSGISTVDNAVSGLSNTFGKYQTIVRIVGERYDKDQVLETEIRELKATNKRIWKNIQYDRDGYEKRISEQERRHEEELATLRERANAGEEEKKKYEEMEKRLDEQHKYLQQQMAKQLKEKTTQLEKANAEKLAALEGNKMTLEKSNSDLEHELARRTLELNEEMETRQILQTKLRTDTAKLKKALDDIHAKYHMDRRPLEFYKDGYNGLIDKVTQIATFYFTDLPDKALDEPARTSKWLAQAAEGFNCVPIGVSEYSRVLRLANVQHIIFGTIGSRVWRPFFSLYPGRSQGSILPDIHTCLSTQGDEVQQHWDVSTLKALDQLDNQVTLKEVRDFIGGLIDQDIITPLQYLLDEDQVDRFKNDLRPVFSTAIELGKAARTDQSPVYFETIPSVSDRDGWKEYWIDPEWTTDTLYQSPTSPVLDLQRKQPLFVSPKIYRHGDKTGITATSTATAEMSGTHGPGRQDIEIIRPGYALFPDTGIFRWGAEEWHRIQNAGKEVARNINGQGRTLSMSMSGPGPGLGLTLNSPNFSKAPSKKWSPEGTREYD